MIVADDMPLPDWFSIANPFGLDVMTNYLCLFQQTQYENVPPPPGRWRAARAASRPRVPGSGHRDHRAAAGCERKGV